ncbi:MAG: mycofactocin glycosyltransferase [Thermoleophilaceae bacterium]|nr:mycofactocin glycosyltransferase [Thermoleophilaceae bacterium]
MFDALGALALGPGDDLVVVNNGAPGLEPPGGAVRVLDAAAVRSSYFARNAGARATSQEWLLFIDADCVPVRDLLDLYFSPKPGEAVGALAGGVVPQERAGSLMERHAVARRLLDQSVFLARERPFAATANLLVRREAWAAVGGFREVRSGGDVDFSWRLHEAGWGLETRPGASVEHRHRSTLSSYLRQRARYGGGAAWLAAAHPGAREPARPLRGAARSLLAGISAGLHGRGEEAAFLGIDSLGYLAHAAGARRSNVPG